MTTAELKRDGWPSDGVLDEVQRSLDNLELGSWYVDLVQSQPPGKRTGIYLEMVEAVLRLRAREVEVGLRHGTRCWKCGPARMAACHMVWSRWFAALAHIEVGLVETFLPGEAEGLKALVAREGLTPTEATALMGRVGEVVRLRRS